MIIEHQIVTDSEGKPVAAQIPWEEFQELQALHADFDENETLSDKDKEELDRRVEALRSGETKAVPHSEVISNLRTLVHRLDREKTSA